MDLADRRYSSPYDYTFNFWNDYLGLSTLVAPNRTRGPAGCSGPNSITESLKATLGLDDSPDEPRRRFSPLRRRPLGDDAAAYAGRGSAGGPERGRKAEPGACAFCRNNGAPWEVYGTHVLKAADGRVLCPILRAYTCPLCGANGDNAHTIKYCPHSAREPPGGRRMMPQAKGSATPGKRLKVFS
ncbi:nanos homolog 1-like [Hippocampus zosterae]|uniref:nanos homolog 1-like n=1 Tax=Hippocampus zosterae TaxID=109293 RepID=UPI00223D881D|nr:nanos homolog 1-like [Hippocampus zosterae]